MKITALTVQQKDSNRVNVMVDGKFRFSLDVFQIGDLGIKIGKEYNEKQLVELETESQFGKLYGRALEYCLSRPHSLREIRDYLYRKTLAKRYRSKKTGEVKERPGIDRAVTERVYKRLLERGYADDDAFTRFWVENRNQRKGTSLRKLQAELTAKGVERSIIAKHLDSTNRNDQDELRKVIQKRSARYPDEHRLIQYLMRQGFSYDDIKEAMDKFKEEEII